MKNQTKTKHSNIAYIKSFFYNLIIHYRKSQEASEIFTSNQ